MAVVSRGSEVSAATRGAGIRPCPSCAAPLAPDARFCSSCGHPVAVAQSEERRVVTVLFADLVGFTGLAEQLDPEQVKRLVEGAFEQLVEDVVAFGGRVDKVLGDGILALFGAPVAHEDDAERAVRAALRMQQSLCRYVERTAMEVPLRMRIGINTGEVLVGVLAGSDYTAMGDVVNTASRIQAEAPPGGVLVGEATFALTSSSIDYGDEAALLPRGREQPIGIWLAQGTLAPPGSRNRRHDLSLVGRSAELVLIEAALQLSVRESRSLLLNVVGDSGVGKTRLIDEIIQGLPEDVFLLEGVCAPYGESNVWAPIAQTITTHLHIDASVPLDQLRAGAALKAAEILGTSPESAEAAQLVEVLLHLLGHPSALDGLEVSNLRETVHRAVTKVIERKSAEGPVVMWIDDLHWADQVVVDLLAHLVGTSGRLPFVLVTSMRPGGDVAWPPNHDRSTMLSIHLRPLDREESDELAHELLTEALDGAAADQRLLASLFDRSGGNPLFLQELAALVADEGPTSELPDSLRALIAARLDQLSAPEREVLDNAATLGVSGGVVSLRKFSMAMHQEFRPEVLAALDAKGYLEIDGRRWQFRSDSVREAVYQMLTKASRAARHAGVAESLASYSPGAFDDLAHHAATAAELVDELGPIENVPTTIRADAVRYLTAAAERARETGSSRLVVRHATRAIGLLSAASSPADRSQLLHLMLVRGGGATELRDFGRAADDIETVLADAIADRDPVLEGHARLLLGTLRHLQGDRDGARTQLGRSVELLRQTRSMVLLAGALRQRGFIELFGGSLVDAEWFFGEAEGVYEELGDERGLAYVEQYRAWLAFLGGDLDLADARLHHAAETLNRLGDRNGVGWAFGLLAFVRFFQRRFEEAEDLAAIVRADASDRGDEWAGAMMLTLLADLRLWSGRLDEALAFAEQARQRFRRLGDRFGLVQSLSALVRIQVALGRGPGVQKSSEELLVLADASPLGPMPLLAVAGAAMHGGDAKTAEGLTERALGDMVDMRSGTYETLIVRAIALAQLGRIDDALAVVDRLSEESRVQPFAQVAGALVHALSGDAARAISEATSVQSAAGASYLDRAIAAVAGAGAHAALGEHDDAALSLDRALTESLAVGDVVAVALLQRTHLHVLGTAHRSGAGDPDALGSGWLAVVAAMPTVTPVT